MFILQVTLSNSNFLFRSDLPSLWLPFIISSVLNLTLMRMHLSPKTAHINGHLHYLQQKTCFQRWLMVLKPIDKKPHEVWSAGTHSRCMAMNQVHIRFRTAYECHWNLSWKEWICMSTQSWKKITSVSHQGKKKNIWFKSLQHGRLKIAYVDQLHMLVNTYKNA